MFSKKNIKTNFQIKELSSKQLKMLKTTLSKQVCFSKQCLLLKIAMSQCLLPFHLGDATCNHKIARLDYNLP